jgi:hypothetical protein
MVINLKAMRRVTTGLFPSMVGSGEQEIVASLSGIAKPALCWNSQMSVANE